MLFDRYLLEMFIEKSTGIEYLEIHTYIHEVFL